MQQCFNRLDFRDFDCTIQHFHPNTVLLVVDIRRVTSVQGHLSPVGQYRAQSVVLTTNVPHY